MTGIGFGITNIILYMIAASGLWGEWTGRLTPPYRRYWWWVCYPAILLHAWLLYRWIDTGSGQNLSALNMFSLVIWVIAVLILLTALRKPSENLGIFVFPLAGLSILLILLFPHQRIIYTMSNPHELWHILLAVLTVSVVLMAGLQAILLAVQEKQLRTRRIAKIWQSFPPLETMELLLFEMIWLGFILLTAVIITSWFFFSHMFSTLLLQKITLVGLAWLILGGLLIGRYYFGWRGRKAVYGTLFGMLLLLLVYFGSQLFSG